MKTFEDVVEEQTKKMATKDHMILQARYDNRRIAINYGYEHAAELRPHAETVATYVKDARDIASAIEYDLNEALKLLGSDDGEAKSKLS